MEEMEVNKPQENGLPPENATKNPTRKLGAETTLNHTTFMAVSIQGRIIL